LLKILQGCVAARPDLVKKSCVEGVALTEKHIAATKAKAISTYETGQGFAWVNALRKDLWAREQTLMTVAHLGATNKHWVALVVDVKDKKICYRDSPGQPIPCCILKAYQWWISQHSPVSFDLVNLPIAHQDDNVSCGIIANDALMVFAMPDTYSLMKTIDV
jgi:hypothetical protein